MRTTRKRWIGAALIAPAVLVAGLTVGSARAGPSVHSLTPVADAYVSSARPTANFGSATRLRADGSPVVRTYVQFAVEGVDAPVTRAFLRVYPNSNSSDGFAVRPVADSSWREQTLTYADAPAVSPIAAARSGPLAAGEWKAVDVTSLVGGNGTLSLALTTSSSAAVALSSRESGARSPELVVETAEAPAPLLGAPATTRLRWIVTGSKMNTLSELDPALGAYHFDTPLAHAIGKEDGTQNQVVAGFDAQPTLKYESYARFRDDVAANRIDPSITSVLYDPEDWALTPDEEKRDPGRFMNLFADLAHAQGLVYVATPSRDLMGVPDAVCGKQGDETYSQAFLRCNIAGKAAAKADIYEVQAQVHERNPAVYRDFVQKTRAQALAANPRVVFLSGLATSPYNYVATSRMLFDAHESVKDLVAGHFFTINSGEEPIAIGFLQLLKASGQ